MIQCVDGQATVSGPMTLEQALSLRADGLAQFTALIVTVDLSAVTAVDSTAISVFFEWQREALRLGRIIRFTQLPANLLSLMALYGVTDLINAC